MARKPLRPRQRREKTAPDYKYNNISVNRFINKINYKGKKTVAEKILYGAFDIIREKTKQEPLEVFTKAMENARPLVVVKARRIGGATYQVPVEMSRTRGETIGMRWIINSARERKGLPMKIKLAEELMSAYKKEGSAVKKKEDTHKMADANRAFAHYRW